MQSEKPANKEVETLIQHSLVSRRNCVVLQTGLENSVPIRILVNVFDESYHIRLTDDDIDPRKPRMIEIQRLLTKHKKLHLGWETFITQKIAEKMPAEAVPTEIKKLFERMLIASLSG